MSSIPQILSTLVQMESVFPNEQRVSSYISSLLADAGFTVRHVVTQGGRNNIVASWGSSQRFLGFYGHMDTVPPASDYTRSPFNVERDGDTLRGLGVCDMKGGLSCIIRSALWAREHNLPVKAIFGVDEENISQGAHDLCSSELLSDVGFLIVAESGQVVDFNQPVSVCLGRKGRIVLRVTVKGRTAHAAEAHKGINAIVQAARLISATSGLQFARHPRLGSTSLVWQRVEAESSAFSVPDVCTLQCSALTSPGDSSPSLISRIEALGRDLGIDVSVTPEPRPTPYGEAYELSTENPFWQSVWETILSPLGVQPIYTASVADENVFAARLGIPVLTIGPIGAGDHTKDEWVSLRSLERVTEIYQRAIQLWAKASI